MAITAVSERKICAANLRSIRKTKAAYTQTPASHATPTSGESAKFAAELTATVRDNLQTVLCSAALTLARYTTSRQAYGKMNRIKRPFRPIISEKADIAMSTNAVALTRRDTENASITYSKAAKPARFSE